MMQKIWSRRHLLESGDYMGTPEKFPPAWCIEPFAGWQLIGHAVLTGVVFGRKKVILDSPLSTSFERNLEKDERKQALLRAIERLPKEQSEVLMLKIWGDLTFDEISRTLDLSLNTVASRYRYALQKLKDSVPQELESGTTPNR